MAAPTFLHARCLLSGRLDATATAAARSSLQSLPSPLSARRLQCSLSSACSPSSRDSILDNDCPTNYSFQSQSRRIATRQSVPFLQWKRPSLAPHSPTQLLFHHMRHLSDNKAQPEPTRSKSDASDADRLAWDRKENQTSNRPVTQKLNSARQRTKAVTAKVKSSLTSLTPRENIYNLPNFLTVSRLFAAPATAYLILHDQHAYALALFAYAGITDLVDGWLARKWQLQTVAGSVIDPMADKALMIILTVTLAAKGAIPVYLATLILGRDAALAVAAIYYRYASLPAPKTFMRYWDFSLPSAEVHPTTISKWNTFLQLILIGSTVALPVVTASSGLVTGLGSLGIGTETLHSSMTYFQWLVASTTVWSGLSYAYLKNAVTILGKDEALRAKQGARGRAIIGVVFGTVVVAAFWSARPGHSIEEQSSNREAARVEEQEKHHEIL